MSFDFAKLKNNFDIYNCTHSENKLYVDDLDRFSVCNGSLVEADLLKCAVLIVLFRSNDEYHVLFTVRSLKLKSFPGEICFPGGKFDKNLDATYADTALREASEEIGLRRENLRVLCQMCPFVTPIGHWILPVVGVLCESNSQSDSIEDTLHIVQSLQANDEVGLIFWIPISFFLDKSRVSFVEVPFKIDDSLKKGNFFSKTNISTFSRLVVQLDDWPFENDVKPSNPILYGINATILMTTVATISKRFDILSLPNFPIRTSQELKAYLNVFRFMAFYMEKNNKLAREKKLKKLNAKL